MSFGKEWLALKHNKIPILFGRNAEMKKEELEGDLIQAGRIHI